MDPLSLSSEKRRTRKGFGNLVVTPCDEVTVKFSALLKAVEAFKLYLNSVFTKGRLNWQYWLG